MPFCPECLREARDGEKFCSFDRNWLYVYLCPDCFSEVLAGEKYCIKCGKDISSSEKKQKCEYKWVGIGHRLLSGLIDFFCCLYIAMVFTQVGYFEKHPWTASCLYFLFLLLYFSFLNSGNRQTIGKQVLGIVSVRSDLSKISPLRSLIKIILIGITFGFGYFFLFDLKKKQTWYDKAIDSVVVELPAV